MGVLKRGNHNKSKKHSRLFWCLVALLLLGAVLAGSLWAFREQASAPSSETVNQNIGQDTPPQEVLTLKEFTADEFRDLYQTFVYPNLQTIEEPPVITGNDRADERIRSIAESRGYQLSGVPIYAITKTGELDLESDDLIQPRALQSWRELKKVAERDRIPLRLTSLYRSVENQRDLFERRLLAAGATVDGVAAGRQDSIVNQVLAVTAPPGYSRHHTGYTIDVGCFPNDQFVPFDDSRCFEWISNNNYEVAKQTGWIPSYPGGTTDQGPEPESWEYVWVGKEFLYE